MENYDDWNDNIYFNCSQATVEACGVPASCCKADKDNKQCGYGVRVKVSNVFQSNKIHIIITFIVGLVAIKIICAHKNVCFYFRIKLKLKI